MSAFEDIEAIGPLRVWNDVVAREVHGEQSTLAVVELGPGAIVPEHQHPNEQLGLVIRGTLEFRVGSETKELGPGGDLVHPRRRPARGPSRPGGRRRRGRLRAGAHRLGRTRALRASDARLALVVHSKMRPARFERATSASAGRASRHDARRQLTRNPAYSHSLRPLL